MGKQWKPWQTIFLGSKITADGDWSHEIKRPLLLGGKKLWQTTVYKKAQTFFANKGPSSQSYGFSSVRVGPWRRLRAKELMLSNCCVGEDSWESLGLQGDQPVNPKGNHPRIFIGRTDAAALIPWPPDAKSRLIWKDPDAGKDWRQEKVMTEDEMVGWYHWLNGHESEQAPGDGEGQGSLACCSPRGCKEPDTTKRLNSNRKITVIQ